MAAVAKRSAAQSGASGAPSQRIVLTPASVRTARVGGAWTPAAIPAPAASSFLAFNLASANALGAPDACSERAVGGANGGNGGALIPTCLIELCVVVAAARRRSDSLAERAATRRIRRRKKPLEAIELYCRIIDGLLVLAVRANETTH